MATLANAAWAAAVPDARNPTTIVRRHGRRGGCHDGRGRRGAAAPALLGAPRSAEALDELTPREREVLSLVAEGRTNAGIARRLWLTEKTVEAHVRSILLKLGL